MNHKIYLGSIKLNNYASFAGEKEFDLRDENGFIHQWTVILGNNNTGKTNFLKAIAGLKPFQYSKDSYAASYYKNLHVDEILIDFEYPSFLYEFYHDIEAVGNVFKKQLKKTIKGNIGGIFILDYPTDLKDLKIYGYGVSRRHGNTGLAAKEENYNSITIFENDISLINIEEWLLQLDYATKNNDNIAEKRLAKLEELIKSEIFPEIIDVRFKSEAAKNYVEFQTLEGWYQLHELGYGYQTTLSWLFDLSKKLFERYPDSDNPLKEPAIVLIDEIDLHLHPKWQRNIIKYLSNIFTQTQFIVTTHSPFIVQSIEKINLFILVKTESGIEVKRPSYSTFKGWSIEEILDEIIGLGEKTKSDNYLKLMNQFDKALDNEDYKQANDAYNQLSEILHPTSPERKLLKLQLSQLLPND